MGCSTMWVFLTLLNSTLRNTVQSVKMVNFMSVFFFFYHSYKLGINSLKNFKKYMLTVKESQR